jgi:DNA-binding NarL/FixJ family response regulator
MTPVRVLLVAQSPVLRYGIRGTLESVLTLESVVEATGTLEAAGLLESAQPSLIVIHDALPGITANVTAKMLQDLQPGTAIAILSDHVEEGHLAAAEQHGANALISMAIAPADFAAAIRDVVYDRTPADDRVIVTARAAGLVAFEIAALDGIVRGLSPRDIAGHLRTDELDVTGWIAAAVEKLGAADRTAAVIAAIKLGIANLSDQLPSPPLAHDLGIATAA